MVHVRLRKGGGATCRAAAVALAMSILAWTGPTVASALPDGRAWEMVSPIDKNGGGIATPSQAGRGAFEAAAQGGAVAFASATSFTQGPGAGPYYQYLARLTAGGWVTENITPPHLSGAYEGAPYTDFSMDLARSLYLNPARCADGDPCPAGYQLRDNLTAALTPSPLDPGVFEGASPDLAKVVFAEGGDLYLWSPPAATLTLVNNAPGAELAAREGAVSTGGARIYWRSTVSGDLFVRDGAQTKQVDADAGGDGVFVAASSDGSVAFFTKEGHLWRYSATADDATDLTPLGGVLGVLGTSDDGSVAFFATATGLQRWQSGTTTQVYTSIKLTDLSTATSDVTASGGRAYFTTDSSLLVADTNSDGDVYQWEGQGTGSCIKSPGCVDLISSGRDEDGSTLIGASADGADVFFLTDRALVPFDPGAVDVYDARVGGGFIEPFSPIECQGDACQGLAPSPTDPALATLATGPGNPKVSYTRYRRRAPKKCRKVKRTGKRVCRAKKGGSAKRRGDRTRRAGR